MLKRKTIQWLVKNDVIDIEDEELYAYALNCVILFSVPLTMSLVIGGILGCAPECLLVVFPFALVRKYSGGHHAKNIMICNMESAMVMSIVIYISKIASDSWTLRGIMLLSIFSLIYHSPLGSDERRLQRQEKIHYKRIVKIMCIIFGVVYVYFSIRTYERGAVSIAIGVITCAGMQLPCIVQRYIRLEK